MNRQSMSVFNALFDHRHISMRICTKILLISKSERYLLRVRGAVDKKT